MVSRNNHSLCTHLHDGSGGRGLAQDVRLERVRFVGRV
jgi:hypothetical protein